LPFLLFSLCFIIACTTDSGILTTCPIFELLWPNLCHLITSNFCSNVITGLFLFTLICCGRLLK
jgi:hypothetical protein